MVMAITVREVLCAMGTIREYISEFVSYLINQVTSIGINDLVDIILVSVVFYLAYRYIRDRRAGKLAVGIIVLVLLQLFSELFELSAMHFIMQNVFQVGLIAILIVFQPELRTMLEKVGGEPLKSLKSIGEQRENTQLATMISALCETACDLSKEKTGALIVIERTTKLGEYIKSGTVINADLVPYMLKNIFFNKAPMHDGAVIIRDMRIYAAGCFLPLSTNTEIIRDLGTRHRAAIGMSENSDAIVLVVSEENGTISMALEGKLKRNFDYITLKKELTELLSDESSKSKINVKASLLNRRIGRNKESDSDFIDQETK